MNLAERTQKLRKFPAAAGAAVLSAVFALLIHPAPHEDLVFVTAWILGVCLLGHVWTRFREDKTYRVSGIAPAWFLLIAGLILLPLTPCREWSLGLVLLSVCAYSAGIIFAVKMVVPFTILLGMAGYSNFFVRLQAEAEKLLCARPAALLMNGMGKPAEWVSPVFQIGKETIPWTNVCTPALWIWILFLVTLLIVCRMHQSTIVQMLHALISLPLLWVLLAADVAFAAAAEPGHLLRFSCFILAWVLFFFPLGLPFRKKKPSSSQEVRA